MIFFFPFTSLPRPTASLTLYLSAPTSPPLYLLTSLPLPTSLPLYFSTFLPAALDRGGGTSRAAQGRADEGTRPRTPVRQGSWIYTRLLLHISAHVYTHTSKAERMREHALAHAPLPLSTSIPCNAPLPLYTSLSRDTGCGLPSVPMWVVD